MFGKIYYSHATAAEFALNVVIFDFTIQHGEEFIAFDYIASRYSFLRLLIGGNQTKTCGVIAGVRSVEAAARTSIQLCTAEPTAATHDAARAC